MDHNHLTKLCSLFELGTPLNLPKRVHGGLLHTMWRVNSAEGSYAVKQLSQHIDLTNESIIQNYDLTEQIASRFSEQGIPVVFALTRAKKYLTVIDGTGFLVYPWVDAEPLQNDMVSELHALKIAEILAKMHLIDLDVPEIAGPVFDAHSNKNLSELIQKACRSNCSFASELTSLQEDIFTINTAFQNTLPLLKKKPGGCKSRGSGSKKCLVG